MTILLPKKTNESTLTEDRKTEGSFSISTEDSSLVTTSFKEESNKEETLSLSSDSGTSNSSNFTQTNYISKNENLGEAQVLVANDNSDWINKKWRPMMGWTYMITCVCDFVLFPVLWSILQAISKGQVTSQWQPVTLMGAGLYHVSMGAILGVTAFMRSKEKIEGKA